MTQLNALASHFLALAMEEFPQPVGTPRALKYENGRAVRHHDARFVCSKITEDLSEEATPDEDRAHRCFLRSLESLRRCPQASVVHLSGLLRTQPRGL